MTIDQFFEQLKSKKYKFKLTGTDQIRCNGCCPIEALSGCTVWEGAVRLGLGYYDRNMIILAADNANCSGRYEDVVSVREKLLTLVEGV